MAKSLIQGSHLRNDWLFYFDVERESFYAVVFGFILSFSFMMSGYEGTMSRASGILTFSILSLVGAICGMALTLIGYPVASRSKSRGSR